MKASRPQPRLNGKHADLGPQWRKSDVGAFCIIGPRRRISVSPAQAQSDKRRQARQDQGTKAGANGTAEQANRSSDMAHHSDRPADQLKREARLFQETLRRALAAPPRKSTKPSK